ncbi:hypothetical protein BP6252_09086 [Coleophoma cylindrospora]|uniref:Uncharacterized protein n=1 Tax=Coleophoma cylindrospora TaxID=1849047 RepID=A0A3D8R178_9HELO|nr:hypothetical protein BP6252_09086 [Coleophoma cylindrospora]
MVNTKGRRGFDEIIVSNCACQPGIERYREPWEELTAPPLAEDNLQPPHFGLNTPGAPFISPWRSNLTALSQQCNLYFAAYQSRIHITAPRNIKQALPGKSDMVIVLPRSPEGCEILPAIDSDHPHAVNHIVIGKLGDHEVLLMGCDDGDVIAFYTHLIMEQFEQVARGHADGVTPLCSVTPFFHENVKSSAWGLAIHPKSRLIAVGSNRREVTVFVFGLTDPLIRVNKSPSAANSILFPDWNLPADSDETPTRSATEGREENFRRTLSLCPNGHNIPSLTFGNDENGQARSVIAVDIHGNLWYLDIWSNNKQCRTSMYIDVPENQRSWGWGIQVLNFDSFKATASPEEAFGTTSRVSKKLGLYEYGGTFDISRTVRKAQTADPMVYSAADLRFEGEEGDDVNDSYDEDPNEPIAVLETLADASDSDDDDAVTGTKAQEKMRIERAVLHQNGHARVRPAQAQVQTPNVLSEAKPNHSLFPHNSAILRTYKNDIELIPASDSLITTTCKNIVRQIHPFQDHFLQHNERLNMTLQIPELSLVIIGSQAGKVALVTLTACDSEFFVTKPVATFRVDYTVPFRSQFQNNIVPPFPLLGIAASPLPVDMGEAGKKRYPRRWRLILHYYDHSIFSYELSRGSAGVGLEIA